MANAISSKPNETPGEELSPVPAGPVSATVPSSKNAEPPAERAIAFEEVQALISLAERLQKEINSKNNLVSILNYILFACIVAVALVTVQVPYWIDDVKFLWLQARPDQPVEPRWTPVGALVITSVIIFTMTTPFIVILYKRNLKTQLDRDERALTDVADMLREAGPLFRQNLSPLGRFLMRVQTWRLDIGIPAEPGKPHPAGRRASHIPIDEDPTRR